MSTFKRNGPVYLKTYGKHKTKVESWLSPDVRKNAFSSTSSSDLSVSMMSSSQLPKRKKRLKSTASSRSTRAAKQKALTALKEKDSDDENIFPSPSEPTENDQKRGDPLKIKLPKPVTKRKKLSILSTSEREEESPCNSKEERQQRLGRAQKSVKPDNTPQLLADLGRFVTNRRRKHLEKQKLKNSRKVKRKENVCVFDSSTDSTEDFIRPRVPRRCVAKRKTIHKGELFLEETGSDLGSTRRVLREQSLNETGDRILRSCYRKPLSSTPSLVSKPSFRHYEPSVSEISFSNDEAEDAFKSSMESDRSMIFPKSHELRGLVGNHLELQKGISFRENLSLGEQSGELSTCKRTATAAQNSKELFSHTDCDKDVSVELSRDCNFVSAKTYLDTLIAAVKDRCRTSNPVIHLQHSGISSDSADQSNKKQDEEYFSFPDCEIVSNGSQSGDKVHRNDSLVYLGNIKKASQTQNCQSQKSDHWFSERLGQTSASVYPEKDSATADQSLHYEPECPKEGILEATVNGVSQAHFLKAGTQPLDDHSRDLFFVTSQMEHDSGNQDNASLKDFSAASCISSQTESVEEVLKAKCISVQPTVSLKRLDLSEYIQGGRAPDPERVGSRQVIHRRTGGNNNCAIRRRLSAVFVSSAAGTSSFSSELVSPVVKRTTDRLRVPDPPKDRPGTGRKACVSGFSVSRWTRKDDQQRKKRGPTGSFTAKTGDSSMFDFHVGLNTQKYLDSMKSCLLSTADVLSATPTHKEPMNMSSFLTNFSPSCMTTHTWRKLKAALSVHKKKKAFITPCKLQLSHNQSSEVGLVDVSKELTASPPCTPFSQCMMSRLPMSAAGTPLGLCSYTEDITDAEKVYHECQQEGPITFEQCIPLGKMKLCKKIGEGTFGEVFSTINDSMETVALKIIPIEGDQKVSGEDQKTFGEILHEIIISKELSSLGARENNRTQGFIGLNNLHCVQGSYPDLLLAAWDKFDKQRMSENDRPDFFPDDQLFLVLEFEFGGCDLENLNCKLSSLAQAKSILHQVAIALAVAEQALCFEHRDLHWGNILVKNTTEKKGTYILNGIPRTFETNGVLVNIIDYSLSRLEIDGLTVSCDISADEELFMGQGDYQFDIYRKMREENNNRWSEYNPHTNVLWLHYLADKLLHMNYKSKSLSKPMKVLKKNMTNFYDEVLGFKCAASVLEGSSLFK